MRLVLPSRSFLFHFKEFFFDKERYDDFFPGTLLFFVLKRILLLPRILLVPGRLPIFHVISWKNANKEITNMFLQSYFQDEI